MPVEEWVFGRSRCSMASTAWPATPARRGTVAIRPGAAHSPLEGQTVTSDDQTSLRLLLQPPQVSVSVRKSSMQPMP